MGCNCKAKQKIQTTKRYFGLETPQKEKVHLTGKDIAKMSILMILGIIFFPLLLVGLILAGMFGKGKTIRLDNFLFKKKK